MFKSLPAILIGLLVSGWASADIRIDEVLVRRKEGRMNLRVNIINPASVTQKGPIKITLYARPDSESNWEQVKVWTNIGKLAAGHRVARDFFDLNNTRLKQISYHFGYPVQEETAVFHPDP
jgi:hypothetical protein